SSNLRFVGLGNYVELLQTPMFWKSLWNTTYFVLIGVPLSIGVSLGAAMLLASVVAAYERGLARQALGEDPREAMLQLMVRGATGV
ncbi:hypothetical protein ACS22U_25790, partial [Escherichia coli]